MRHPRIISLPSGPPGGKPIPGVTNLGDVEWELNRARRFVFRGGDPAEVADFVNVWLDYRATLRGTSLEHLGGAHELAASQSKEHGDG